MSCYSNVLLFKSFVIPPSADAVSQPSQDTAAKVSDQELVAAATLVEMAGVKSAGCQQPSPRTGPRK